MWWKSINTNTLCLKQSQLITLNTTLQVTIHQRQAKNLFQFDLELCSSPLSIVNEIQASVSHCDSVPSEYLFNDIHVVSWFSSTDFCPWHNLFTLLCCLQHSWKPYLHHQADCFFVPTITIPKFNQFLWLFNDSVLNLLVSILPIYLDLSESPLFLYTNP